MRVVLAEDNALLRAGLAELLRGEGIHVVGEAGDASELLEVVRRTRPDVVVLDVRMPPTHTVEGLVAAQRIRAEHGDRIGLLVLPPTSRPGTRSTCSPTARTASATCSRTGFWARPSWSTPSGASPLAGPRSTRR